MSRMIYKEILLSIYANYKNGVKVIIKKKVLSLVIFCVFSISFTFGSSAFAYAKDECLQNGESELSAHRGAHVVAPENSTEAIKWAGLLGYGFVEIDIQTTKDGHYVLMHDSNIDRTTTGSGEIKDLTLEEIKSYDMVTEDGTVTDYKVPALDEALNTASEYGVGVNFDGSKGEWDDKQFVDDVMNVAAESKVLDCSFFVLSDEEIRDQFNEWYPEATVTFLGNASKNVDEDIEELEKYNHAIYTTSINNINKESAEKIDEADLPLHVYQVNSADLYTEATDLDPRLMETDIIVPGGANELQTSVNKLQEDDVIKDGNVAHSLELHLTSIDYFEKQEEGDKVVKHMNGFKDLIMYQNNAELISEPVYNMLDVNSNKIINKWQ